MEKVEEKQMILEQEKFKRDNLNGAVQSSITKKQEKRLKLQLIVKWLNGQPIKLQLRKQLIQKKLKQAF